MRFKLDRQQVEFHGIEEIARLSMAFTQILNAHDERLSGLSDNAPILVKEMRSIVEHYESAVRQELNAQQRGSPLTLDCKTKYVFFVIAHPRLSLNSPSQPRGLPPYCLEVVRWG